MAKSHDQASNVPQILVESPTDSDEELTGWSEPYEFQLQEVFKWIKRKHEFLKALQNAYDQRQQNAYDQSQQNAEDQQQDSTDDNQEDRILTKEHWKVSSEDKRTLLRLNELENETYEMTAKHSINLPKIGVQDLVRRMNKLQQVIKRMKRSIQVLETPNQHLATEHSSSDGQQISSEVQVSGWRQRVSGWFHRLSGWRQRLFRWRQRGTRGGEQV